MRQKRRKFSLSRRRYDQTGRQRRQVEPANRERSDIIDIWREQKRIREEEVRLEREYEAATKRLRDIKIQMKRNKSMLSDATDLQTTLLEEFQLKTQNYWLWLAKSYTKFKLRLTILYIKLRSKLGIPLKRGAGLRFEKTVLAVFGAILIVGAFYLIWLRGSSPVQSADTASQDSPTPVAADIPLNVTPEFSVLSPNGQGVSSQGGFALVSPVGKDPVYAYVDKLNNVNIRVSQQQLPQNFKDDSLALAKLAGDYNASRTLSVGDMTVYIGRSEKGPQSLIFGRDDLLILISSDGEIADQDWITYIEKLKL